MKRFTHVLLIGAMATMGFGGLTGCANSNNAQKGAVIGGATGAVIGGVIGDKDDKTARGVLIGTAIGGTAGAIIGRQMDKQAEELEEDLEGADVERVGEGIQITFDSAILFEVDEADLSANAQDNLRDLAASLQNYPETEVTIFGHTDSTGPENYNEQLSLERAAAAASYLMRNEIQANRITTIGYGESMPIASNDTATGRQQNRRVEIAIYASEDYRASLQENGSSR